MFTFTTVLKSGYTDVIIAFTVFLPFALLASAFSFAMNAWLFHWQLRKRLAQQGNVADSHQAAQAMGPIVTTHSACQRLTLEQLMTRFVLHQAQRKMQDRTRANDIKLKQFGMSLLLLLTEARFHAPLCCGCLVPASR